MIREFMDMLKYKRPSFGQFEEIFIDEFITPLDVMEDDKGNLFKRIPYPNGDKPDIMFSCHTDSVHNEEGYQVIKVKGQYLELHNHRDSNCLGADDCSGVWLMMEMIRAEKPGLYVFHRGEEIGGVGSSYIASTTPEVLQDIKCCIALDRKGTRDIITHQGSRCCSDEFGLSLAKALNGKFELSDRGTFTDSANYTDLIGECTNISVGYDKQHSYLETQDFKFLSNLRLKLINLDYTELVFKRQAGEMDEADRWTWKDYKYDSSTYKLTDPKHTLNPWNDDIIGMDDDPLYVEGYNKVDWDNFGDYDTDPSDGTPGEAKAEGDEEFGAMELYDMVKDYPDIASRLLKACGVTESDFADEVYLVTGDLV